MSKMFGIAHFNPRDRAREKQMARDEDARLLAGRVSSAEQINHRNGFFSKADLPRAEIIGRRKAVLVR
jgi:hypothetical protein